MTDSPELDKVVMIASRGHIQTEYLLYLSDERGPLYYIRLKPDPLIWLRDGATVEDIARVWHEWNHRDEP